MINKKQSGLTAISWMIILAYLAIQGILAMRILPVYLNYNSLQDVVTGLSEDKVIKGKGVKAIRKVLRKRLKINGLYDLAGNKDAFKFTKIEGGFHLMVKYEERGPIFKNLNFMVDFEYEADLKTR